MTGPDRSHVPTSADLEHVRAYVRRYGPTSGAVYRDSQGRARVGRGARIDHAGARERLAAIGADLDELLGGEIELTGGQIDALYEEDIATAVAAARSVVPEYDGTPLLERQVAVSLLFNLGVETIETVRATVASTCGDTDLEIDGSTATRWYDQPTPPA